MTRRGRRARTTRRMSREQRTEDGGRRSEDGLGGAWSGERGASPEVGGRWGGAVDPAAPEQGRGEGGHEPAVSILFPRFPFEAELTDEVEPENGEEGEREVTAPEVRGQM